MSILQKIDRWVNDAVLCKGGGDGGSKAQANAQRDAISEQKRQFDFVMNQLQPFMSAGQPALDQIQQLSTLEGQGQALNGYYGSQQFNDMSNQANYQNMASAEAMGGLGSTATSNQLASIAPMLGQNWLSNQMQNQSNLLNVGMSAAAGQASAGQNYANNAGQLMQNIGAINAASANRPSGFQNALSGGLTGAGAGAQIGTMFGGPGIGTAIGGGLGALGGLF